MIEFYAQIKWVHIIAVLCSGSLFLLRGLLVQAGKPRIAMAAPVRYLSYGIDTTLLTAALMLLTILPGVMFANGWLTIKTACCWWSMWCWARSHSGVGAASARARSATWLRWPPSWRCSASRACIPRSAISCCSDEDPQVPPLPGSKGARGSTARLPN